MKVIITRRARGETCLLTRIPPWMEFCGLSDRVEPYAAPGDPVAWQCCYDVLHADGIELEPLQSQAGNITFTPNGDPYFLPLPTRNTFMGKYNDCDVVFSGRFKEHRRRTIMTVGLDVEFDDDREAGKDDEIRSDIRFVARSDFFKNELKKLDHMLVAKLGSDRKLKMKNKTDEEVHQQLGEFIAMLMVFHNNIADSMDVQRMFNMSR